MKGTTTADKTKKVGITLPITLVKQTDKVRQYARSTFIERAIHQKERAPNPKYYNAPHCQINAGYGAAFRSITRHK